MLLNEVPARLGVEVDESDDELDLDKYSSKHSLDIITERQQEVLVPIARKVIRIKAVKSPTAHMIVDAFVLSSSLTDPIKNY